jgi:hypothetical protein
MSSNREAVKIISISRKSQISNSTYRNNTGNHQHLGLLNTSKKRRNTITNRDISSRKGSSYPTSKIFSSLRGFMQDLQMNNRLRLSRQDRWLLEAAMTEDRHRLDQEARLIMSVSHRDISSQANLGSQRKDPLVNQCFISMGQWEKVAVNFTEPLFLLVIYCIDQLQSIIFV